MNEELTVIDLFCGAGGFSEGFRQAGFKIILGVDNDRLACETYKLNQNCSIICQDILEPLQTAYTDIVIGSPPCPHFSDANRNFKEEPDVRYVNHFLQLIKIIQPKYWIMENVVGVLDYLDVEAYNNQILQANRFGLYHKRERVFIGKFPKIKKRTDNEIRYPTVVACDDHVHSSTNNPNISCVSDYFGFSPDIDVFKKIMGFPSDYVFVGKKKDQIRQIGNAVCPPVARAIADAIKELER